MHKKYFKKESRNIWFYILDIILIFILTLRYSPYFICCCMVCNICDDIYGDFEGDDKNIYLCEINGIHIKEYRLPLDFENLKEKEKINMIFKKENMEKYKYFLNNNQINLI